MADSRYALPQAAKRGAAEAEALNRQLLAVEADIQAGRLPEAAESLNQLVAANPNDGRLYVAGWLLANKAGNVDAALLSAERAVALAPNSGTALFCLSDAQHKLGDIDAARKNVEAALRYMPNNLHYLQHAVNLANAQSDYVAAEKHLRAAYAQNNVLPGIKTLIGNCLRHQGKHDESDRWLSEAASLNVDDDAAHHGLAMLAYQRDDMVAALAHIQQALRVRPNEPDFAYFEAVFSGVTPPAQPDTMTRELFDAYAKHFDAHLLNTLKYQTPQLIAQKVLERFPTRDINLLDLGCGTGLFGAALGAINGYFVGVDLSFPMLEEAKKRNVYSRLHHVNLLDALDATDANEYEVIVAADVFVYLGALDIAIRDSFKVLKPGGWLFFSCETAPVAGPDFVLRKSMRYAQSPAYVERLLSASGFATPVLDTVALRQEADGAIEGFLVAAQKPG